jgi:hypothetical protein
MVIDMVVYDGRRAGGSSISSEPVATGLKGSSPPERIHSFIVIVAFIVISCLTTEHRTQEPCERMKLGRGAYYCARLE